MERGESMCQEEELVESFRLDSLSSRVDPERCLSWEESLLQLVEWTRMRVGQEKLADGKAVPIFLSLLKRLHTTCLLGQSSDGSLSLPASFTHILQLFLKLLRNLCVSDTNKNAFLAEKGPRLLVRIATALLSICKATPDSNLSKESAAVKLSCEPTTYNLASANSFPENAHNCTKVRADLEAIGRSSGAEVTSSTSERVPDAGDVSVSTSIECLRMLLQLLGNFSRGGDACQATVWQEFYPVLFPELASLRSKPISDVLSMILYTCCQGNKERSWQVCQGQGVGLMSLLIWSAVTNEEMRGEKQIDWFEALWRHLCVEEKHFPLLFTNLGIIPVRQELDFSKVHTEEYYCACQIWLQTCTFTFVQVNLLSLLVDSLTDDLVPTPYVIDDEKAGLELFSSKESMCFMVKILERAADCVREEWDMAPVAHVPPWTSAASASNQILGYLLIFWRVLGTCHPKTKQRDLLTQVLLQHGLLNLLLKMLEALGPPEAPGRKPKDQNTFRERTFSGPAGVPLTDCYQGYRRDIVAVIANVSHENRLVQDHVRETGKLLLVLQQCTVDEHNLFLREWGLWAMRNLLEGNDLNQKEVASLEMREAVNLPELNSMGLRFELDPNTGAPRLVNIGSQK